MAVAKSEINMFERHYSANSHRVIGCEFLVNDQCLNMVLIKGNSEVIFYVLHYKVFGNMFCNTALQLGLSECWQNLNKF